MSPASNVTDGEQHSLNAVFDCLASGYRRRLLADVHDRSPDDVTEEELATFIAASEHAKPRDNVTDEERKQARTVLHHLHLPKLDDAGLIEWNANRTTVAVADHPAYRDPGILDALDAEATESPESLDALFAGLASARSRTILDVLSHQFGPIHTETLAREVGAKERGTVESNVPETVVERILVSLHHVHLPHLSKSALIEYDADEQTVAYEGHPTLRVPWMHSVLAPDFRSSLTGESEVHEIGTIEGRENVVSFGQSLCDRADEELFTMFTDTHLIEEGCLTRIRDASRRGVDVYLGTCDPTVREYIQENAPEVVLWEPKTDWLNLPAEGNKVGRLLLADREAVMLGTLGEKKKDDFFEEQSIIGEGGDNTLVVMICQMLHSRLAQFDEGTEEIETQLPF